MQNLSWVNIPLRLVAASGTQALTEKKELEEAHRLSQTLAPPWAHVTLHRPQWPLPKSKRDPEMWRGSSVSTVVPATVLP